MWLLNTRRAELRFFVSPESVPGGYAILSHVWDTKEQSFQEIQELGKRCATFGVNPRDLVGPKTRQFCTVAERDGHKWGWADTCCIDKTSSAELSEAINSMYRYYTLADTCYAYLRDVPTGDSLSGRSSSFRDSRWHERGWTLQELIAPVLLIFLSQDWEKLGTKAELAEVLKDVTGVPAAVLRSEEELSDFSIAQRMSWAANRETTRQEDEAYCLMGIFGVNMPTLYGEGRLAFRRLQEEIMRQSIDTTLFAWGDRYYLRSALVSAHHDHLDDDPNSYLFAGSPSDFKFCNNISFIPPPSASKEVQTCATCFKNLRRCISGWTSSVQSAGLPTFSITPYGVHARIPVLQGRSATGDLIAVLFWGDGHRDAQESLGLYLTPCPDAADPLRPLYHCGFRRLRPLDGHTLDNLSFQGKRFKPKWKELYIAHSPPSHTKTIVQLPLNSSLTSPFHFPRQQIEALHTDLDFELINVVPTRYSWDGSPAVHFLYKSSVYGRNVVLQFGRCVSSPLSSEQPQLYHWANVLFYEGEPPRELPEHSCAEDHICEWPDFTRTFEDYEMSTPAVTALITLSFKPWKHNPTATLVANVSAEWVDTYDPYDDF